MLKRTRCPWHTPKSTLPAEVYLALLEEGKGVGEPRGAKYGEMSPAVDEEVPARAGAEGQQREFSSV